MSFHVDAPILTVLNNPNDIENAEQAIKKYKEKNDSQTVFYLNRIISVPKPEDLEARCYE